MLWCSFILFKELNLQGEKLRGIETKIDEINDNLTATQKNINQIKSVFGGIKNKFLNWSSSSSKSTSKPETDEKILNAQPSQKPQAQQTKAEFVKITNSAREAQIGNHLGT